MYAWRAVLLVAWVPAVVWAQTIPITPVPVPSGKSNIEQRYVYAPPDKGSFRVPLLSGGASPNEVAIEEPPMCDKEARAYVDVTYDKSANLVTLDAHFKKALPFRMSYTRPVDISTPYNKFPVSVQNGKWQLWFVGRLTSFDTTFYYSATTLQLLGNEQDFPAGPPAGSFPVAVPTLQMLCSPVFEGDPEGNADIHLEYKYDQMLDGLGNGGTYSAFLPFNVCKPDEYGTWYLNGGLPPSKAMNFDQVLAGIWAGYGMAFASSLEPDPKPAYLTSRDNNMVGWAGTYPGVIPSGFGADPQAGTLFLKESCGTKIMPNFSPAYFNVCGP
jgi:hypothetical protein